MGRLYCGTQMDPDLKTLRAAIALDHRLEEAGAVRRLPVRLVKGAYWDGEIKRAQQLGMAGYPVFTRRAATDLCYAACATRNRCARGRS